MFEFLAGLIDLNQAIKINKSCHFRTLCDVYGTFKLAF